MANTRLAAVGAFVVGGVLLFSVGLFLIGSRRMLFSDTFEIYATASLSYIVGTETINYGTATGLHDNGVIDGGSGSNTLVLKAVTTVNLGNVDQTTGDATSVVIRLPAAPAEEAS